MNYSLDYNNMSDEELINSIRADDKKALDFLICKYKDLVNSKVNKYFIIGAEKEDIVQEGLLLNHLIGKNTCHLILICH